MYFTRAELKNFRNYEELTVEFHPKVNILVGKNAQGKTNLLESLSVMSFGKSFRTSRDSEMIGFGKDFCRVKTESVIRGIEQVVEILYSEEGKKIKIDGVKGDKSSSLLERAYIVTFSPEDLKIVKDEPEKRRRFMDREICQIRPVYYKSLGNYKKVLFQRNSLLKREGIEESELEVWDQSLAQWGAGLIKERETFIKKLNVYSRDLHKKITDGREEMEIFYEADVPVTESPEEQKEVFLSLLKEGIRRDIFKGNTGKGPHKDDIKISVEGKDLRQYGSQGQQRTAALSLKLAELNIIKEETGENAVLLLDDVLSELDMERQRFLIDALSDVQLFISATEMGEDLKKSLPEGKLFHVEKGKITKSGPLHP